MVVTRVGCHKSYNRKTIAHKRRTTHYRNTCARHRTPPRITSSLWRDVTSGRAVTCFEALKPNFSDEVLLRKYT